MYIAIVSTTVETSNPIAELNPGIALLKDIVERFDSVNDLLAPVADGTGDKCYISKSYDATRCVRGGGRRGKEEEEDGVCIGVVPILSYLHAALRVVR